MNLKNITNSWPFTLEKFKITLEQIFLTVGQNNYGNKIPDLTKNNLYSQDPNVVAQVLEFALSMEVPPQDSIVTLTSVASNRYSYKQAWTFFANNIDKITKRYRFSFSFLFFFFFIVKAKLIYIKAELLQLNRTDFPSL